MGGVPAKEMVIMFNGTVLKDDKKPLKEHGVKNGDMVVMEKVKKQTATPMLGGGLNLPDFSKIKIPGASGGGGGKSASEVEDQQIAEAMARSQSEMKKEEP